VDYGGSRHELTQNIDMIGDVKTGDSKVEKTHGSASGPIEDHHQWRGDAHRAP
jgi:hypothetical protein